jgi:tetratricopeptide (TPR) repeat protein
VLFLEKRYADAVAEFEKTLAIDPEDLQAHYNLMLCYAGLVEETKAEEHKARYLRFKADEAAQAITGPYRERHPEDNNERQAIHEHFSVALTAARQQKPAATKLATAKAAKVKLAGKVAIPGNANPGGGN